MDNQKAETCEDKKETPANTLSARFRKAIPVLTVLNTLLIIAGAVYMFTMKPKIVMLQNTNLPDNKKEQKKNIFFEPTTESQMNYSFMSLKERQNIALKHIMIISGAICNYRLDTGHYPLSLSVLSENTGNIKTWKGPYIMDKIPKDPWGNDYVYIYPGKNSDFDVISYGEDGSPGGTGANKDITRH